ncbi:hypothetical protein SNE40_021269 [Patella caerulea]|uniref:Tesmin/TSO1-like CXC domain-containing protein n=1 Tax=Patella caerulea TaxID=87958 RepID=A0AAN8GIK6_PATCE
MGDDNKLNPTDWGWELCGETLFPRRMDTPLTPPHLLKVVRCTCKGECATKKCSCRRYGLECTNVCASCKGETCANSSSPVVLDEDELEETVWMDL